MRFGQRIIEARTLFQLRFIERLAANQGLGGFRAVFPQTINFISQPRRAANRKRRVTLCCSHKLILAQPQSARIERQSDSGISVCPTSRNERSRG